MKYLLLCVYIFFSFLHVLFAQDTLYLEPYNDLNPDINILKENTLIFNLRRKLFFYQPHLSLSFRETEPILISEMPETAISSFPDEQISMDQRYMVSTYFWDPHTRSNYMFCNEVLNPRNEIRGWYLLDYSDNFLTFYIHNNNQHWANHSPPNVQLSETMVFTAQYEFFPDAPILSSTRTLFTITNTYLDNIIWQREIFTSRGHFPNIYWLTEQWYILQWDYYMVMGIGGINRQNSIYNYKTNEIVSFEPEIIIGYGKGVVLTTNEQERGGFIGITVWTPEKEILYRDSNFLISGFINREQDHIIHGRPYIYISYFDYPYIYCNIGIGLGTPSTYGTLIMNLMDGKTYYTPYRHHLFAIFDIE